MEKKKIRHQDENCLASETTLMRLIVRAGRGGVEDSGVWYFAQIS